jgi:quercetin dioxygenase-like cupin family protein
MIQSTTDREAPVMTTASQSLRARLAAVSTLALAVGMLIWSAGRGDTREEVKNLLRTSKTILDQPIVYPAGAPAEVTSAIITIEPGGERGWHKHDVPLFGYVLEGELTIDFGPQGRRVFRKGEAFVEAIGVPHNGRNLGSAPVRILAVFMSKVGTPDTVMVAQPQ